MESNKLMPSVDPISSHIWTFTTAPKINIRLEWPWGEVLNTAVSVDYAKHLIAELQKAVAASNEIHSK